MTKHTISLALMGLALLAVGAIADETTIGCGTVITQPGMYHVAQDLTCTSSPYGIDIEASDVQLYFDGHNLTGGGIGTVGTGVGVGTSQGGISNVSIIGSGTVTGFGFAGIVVGTPINSPVFKIRIVSITANKNGVGIKLYQTISGAIISNIANSNTANGIEVDAISSDVLLSNQTDRNGNYGIKIALDSVGSLLRDNAAQGNLTLDFFDNGAGGPPFCLNTWKSNQFGTAFPSCIH